MIPAKTSEYLGVSYHYQRFDPDHSFALTGTDLNDLYALAARLNGKMIDGNELRDWQNRISLMVMTATRIA
jgi:hypothetical protein